MENNLFSTSNNPIMGVMYTKRSSREEVEVIAFNQEISGARSEGDWVTYIDSNGEEHIKEPLNIQLDFKPTNSLPDMFSKIMGIPDLTAPSIKETRMYDLAKELIMQKDYSIERAAHVAKELVDKIHV